METKANMLESKRKTATAWLNHQVPGKQTHDKDEKDREEVIDGER